MNMEKSTDKRLEQAEKLEAEIKRSLDVVEMKKAHCQIEEVDKNRKKPSILSIIERIDLNCDINRFIYKELDALQKHSSHFDSKQLPENVLDETGLDIEVKTFESIRFDLQRTLDVKNEDFDKLFPKLNLKFHHLQNILTSLNSMNRQMTDMKTYCKRLI